MRNLKNKLVKFLRKNSIEVKSGYEFNIVKNTRKTVRKN